jgi:hypothetical protein
MEREILHVKTGAAALAAQQSSSVSAPGTKQTNKIPACGNKRMMKKTLLKKMSLREQLFFSQRHFLFNLWRSDHH